MRTKIIATIGPASASREVIVRLAKAGASIFRLNFSHGDAEFFRRLIKDIRFVEKELGRPLSILQDLAGPKIRLGVLESGSIEVSRGELLLLGSNAPDGSEFPLLPLDNPALMDELLPGDILVLADGGLRFTVRERMANELVLLESLGTGIVTSRKGIALPGKTLSLPALTAKDCQDLLLGLELGVDAVAVSFVQSAADIRQVRALLRQEKSVIPVVAKLERRNAVNDLDAILEASDMIMVARGDLGVECALPELPALQKRIIRACNQVSKPVIVATQMLLSMVSSPSPTRAETTDIANAIYDGTTAIMLSGESAAGKYPVEAVKTMAKIAEAAEKDIDYGIRMRRCECREQTDITTAIAYATCTAARDLHAAAIITVTLSGFTAEAISRFKPESPIIGCTVRENVCRQLNLLWGVSPLMIQKEEKAEVLFADAVEKAKKAGYVKSGDVVVITAGVPLGVAGTTNMIHVIEVA